MTQKFTAKEIHFLKNGTDGDRSGGNRSNGSEDQPIHPPDIYFSDLLHDPSVRFTAFEKRLADTKIPGDKFICALVQIDQEASEETREKAGEIFEACFHSVLDSDRGIWESLDDTAFVLVFWDYKNEKDGTRLLTLLKEKISGRLNEDLAMGIAVCPFHDFEQHQILGNALKAFDHAAFFGPNHYITFDAVSLNISGDRLFQLGRHEEAIAEYEKGLAIDSKNINLINSLGVSYGIMDQLDKALDCFEQASAISPEEVMVIYNIGLIHRIKDKEDKAVLYLKKAHAINPEIFEIELLLGHLLFKQDQFDQAMPYLDAAVRLNPESGTAFRLKGQILLDKNDLEEAGTQFNMAVKRSPNDAVALSGYARTMALRQKNLSIALSFAKKARDLDPENPLFSQSLEEIQEICEEARAMNRDKPIKSA